MLRSRIVHIVRKVPWQAERRFASQAFRGQKLDSRILFGAAAFVGGNALWFGMRSPALAEAKEAAPRNLKEDMKASYENRIKAFSSPEKVFQMCASVKKQGEMFMTPEDFLNSVTPSTAGDSDDDEKREPSRHAAAASKRLFQLVDMDADGFVSFHEYIFFTTLLGIPESKFSLAFRMFDLNENGDIDQQEFSAMLEVLKAKNPVAAAARSDVVSASNAVKRKKRKAAAHDKCTYPVLFGKDGKQKLNYDRFTKYLHQLKEDLLTMEFESFGPDRRRTISGQDFARSLISHLYPKQQRLFMKRIATLEDSRVSMPEFLAFDSMIQHLDEIGMAMEMFSEAEGESISAEQLMHASRAVAGVQLSHNTVAIVYQIFATPKAGTLNHQEFMEVMNKRRFHGAARKRSVDPAGFLSCCRKCWKANMTLS
mmetsp:Transcript_5348/g.12914  ORF Transcript_5348/g.12914 Transcript_5348/m.12914 type:complete len:425 (-) Transcript_5348:106-1380(-)|eukprot:CAMPEP_0177719822 /NCGR_PEP_ID=MMETSP0484_2-20121128/16310_1 /TAXON_ID=354590 /ORGANISM="Rhodomonas lens, Strain RHODO" /LENGTH=424 /DNA_ID=CAMNT_0019232069 /DNA_START=88 /DNA_END=1362 /DNA_ORIENTATION=-